MKSWNEYVSEFGLSPSDKYQRPYNRAVLSSWNTLTDKEKSALALILTYKAFAREDMLEKAQNKLPPQYLINYAEFKELIPSLIRKRILKGNQSFVLSKTDWTIAGNRERGIEELAKLKSYF